MKIKIISLIIAIIFILGVIIGCTNPDPSHWRGGNRNLDTTTRQITAESIGSVETTTRETTTVIMYCSTEEDSKVSTIEQ